MSGGVGNGSGLSRNKEELVSEVGYFGDFRNGSDDNSGDDLAAEEDGEGRLLLNLARLELYAVVKELLSVEGVVGDVRGGAMSGHIRWVTKPSTVFRLNCVSSSLPKEHTVETSSLGGCPQSSRAQRYLT